MAPSVSPRPFSRTFHGRTVEDPFAWLIDPDDPETIPHLEAENAWTRARTAGQEALRSEIFDEIKRRTKETDMSVPVRDGNWWYLTRTEEGKAYPIHCRHDGIPLNEQIVIDPNEIAEDGEYLSLGILDVSPDGNWLAYGIDRSGDERHVLRFRDLRTGLDAEDTIEDVSYGFAWAHDSQTCWYTTIDDAERPHEVWRHKVNFPESADERVFSEPDERFHVTVGASRSGDIAVISTSSAVTDENWLLDAHNPLLPPQVVAPRAQGIEYSVAHRPGELFITSNHGAEDFALWRADLSGLTTPPPTEWELVVAQQSGRRINGVETFATHVIVHGRENGSTAIWVLDPATKQLQPFPMDDEVGTLSPSANPSFDATEYRFGYESLGTPPSLIEQTIATGERVVLKQMPVLDGFDPSAYRTARQWATAPDGTRVPISLVWRPERQQPDAPNPCLLYGYGAYEVSMDPWFSIARLSLLDRGFTFAIAHIRGGGELGRAWYENGKFGLKKNSFSDFVACAKHLCDQQITSPELLAARGGSAGGLLMGASTNLDPSAFRAVVAEVPFVDPLNTMLDPTLPLTVIEREEWGDPLNDPQAYEWLEAYSPYENVRAGSYPAILATAGLSDPRVGFHEPAKWVAKLRELGHKDVLVKVEMGAGHGGPSGRYDTWRDEAFVLAWIVTELGEVPVAATEEDQRVTFSGNS